MEIGSTLEGRVSGRAETLLSDHRNQIYKQTDRLMAALMALQWIFGIVAAVWISPRTWEGLNSNVNIHVWAAIVLGGLLSTVPIVLALSWPGQASTRQVIAISQMLWSALLIHLTGGRIETHFHVFGSLAFLAFYRDWKVLLSATIVVALDHMLRGMFYPQSVFGVATVEPWRWVEHAGWVIFEDVFLIVACRRSMQEMKEIALRQARMEAANELTEAKVEERTAELKVATEEALAGNRAKSEFLANMSHEIRTPMNGIMGMNDLLLMTKMTEEQKGYANTIRVSADSLLTILNDILDFSKIEAGKLELDEAEFDLIELVEEVGSLWAGTSYEKGIELIVSTPARMPHVRGDGGRLRQILNNLVANAVKFTEQGEIVVRLTERSRMNGVCYVRLSVADTGIGISEDRQSAIFESFTQVDGSTTRMYGGTGLGLAICRQLSVLMGGNISVESSPGNGSTFNVDIPLATAETGERLNGHADLRVEGARILIVDDNDTNRKIVAENLRYWKCEWKEASSGEEALEIIQSDPTWPELVLLDFQMPNMDGIQTVQAIRKIAGAEDMKIVVLSSVATVHSTEDEAKLGIFAWLTKPVRQSQLLSLVKKAIVAKGKTEQEEDQPEETHALFSTTILLAEDHLINQEVTVLILEKLGCAVEVAKDGREAVTMAEGKTYDLILMDIHMPVLDGILATVEIRRSEASRNRETPIVAMTASADRERREKCLAAGMNDFLAKPVKASQLAELVAGLSDPGREMEAA